MDETLPPQRPEALARAARTVDPCSETDVHPTVDRVGPYRVEAMIGAGGMGKVYRAHDESLDRRVAIKVLHEKFSNAPEHEERFQREARALASVSHANVAQVFGIDRTDSGSLYIAMELVEGSSVEDLLRTDGSIELERALRITREVAAGLQSARSKGLIHRDIKPSNLLVARAGGVKIVDFGLSKEIRGKNSITDEGVVLGTPHYLSPEQGRGHPVDARSDIYSLGATLYHMVCGRPPFEGDSQLSVIVAHVQSDPPAPHEIASVPRTISALIGKMMARSPDDRYARYDDLLADIDRVIAGEMPEHAPGGRFGDLRPTRARRGWLAVGLGATALILSIVVVTIVRRTPDPALRLAGDLGLWSLPGEHGLSAVDLDFSSPPPSLANPIGAAITIAKPPASLRGALTPEEEANAPRLREGALVWDSFRSPIAFAYPFARLDDIRMDVRETRGAVHWELAIVDPVDPSRRALRIRVDSTQVTRQPLRLVESGEDRELDAGLDPLPRLTPPYTVHVALRPTTLGTLVRLEVLRSRTHEMLYVSEREIPGSSWSQGVALLRIAGVRRPFGIALARWALSGAPTGERLTEAPWLD